MKNNMMVIAIELAVAAVAVAVCVSVVLAGTVVMDDSLNHESFALTVDRILVDSCARLLDCRKGTQTVNATALFSSKRAQTATLPLSTWDANNLSAYQAGTATSATSAQKADTAVWADSANDANAGVTAFASTGLTSTALVDAAVKTTVAGHVTYAAAASNPGYEAVYAYWFTSTGGSLNTKATERLYPSRPVGFSEPDRSEFVRTASSYYNPVSPLDWAVRTGRGTAYTSDQGWTGALTSSDMTGIMPSGVFYATDSQGNLIKYGTVSGQFTDTGTAY